MYSYHTISQGLLWPASLVAQLVKNQPAIRETPVWFLGREDPLEKEPLSILGLPWWLRGKRIRLRCERPGIDPWVGKIPWKRARHSSLLAWRIPMDEEPGGLQSISYRWARWVPPYACPSCFIRAKISQRAEAFSFLFTELTALSTVSGGCQ